MRLICSLLLSAAGCWSADNTLTPAEERAGWHLLFNGTSYDGWNNPALASPAGDSWEIEDGCLKSRAKPRLGEDLVTKDSFRDFEMAFEWRISPGGNSGVKYRIQDRIMMTDIKGLPGVKTFEQGVDYFIKHPITRRPERGGEYVVGFEYQVIDNARHKDAQRGPKYQTGAVYGFISPVKNTSKPVGEWNHSRIVLRDNRVEHWLNGMKIVDSSLDSPQIAENSAKRWTEASPVYEMLTRQPKKDCSISLQNHGNEAWFRNIKIRRLDAAARGKK